MNRSKLRRLGIDLPLLPTTTVGSLPKPPELLAARAAFRRGRISQRELDSLTEEATLFWLQRQREIGLDVLVDGELYRGDMVAYFADALEGMVLGGLVRSYGNRYYPKPIIRGAVRWLEPITVGWWRFASAHADAPVKAVVTGPYTMMDWSFDEHYAEPQGGVPGLRGGAAERGRGPGGSRGAPHTDRRARPLSAPGRAADRR